MAKRKPISSRWLRANRTATKHMSRYLKPVLVIALLVGACLSGSAAPGDQPISRLPALTNAPTIDDLLVIVDDPNGTPVTKKITVWNAFGNAPVVPTNIVGSISTNVSTIVASNSILNLGQTLITNLNSFTFLTNLTSRTFNVSSFGANGTGKVVTRCNMTSGTKVLTTANGTFSQADVGKVISVYGGGSANQNLTSIITNVASATSITLSNAAASAVVNMSAVYGPDETTNIQAALNYVSTNGGTLRFPQGIYVVAGPLLDTGTNLSHHNAQLHLPDVPLENGQVTPSIALVGTIRTLPRGQGPSLGTDINTAGAVIWSTLVRGPDVNGGRMLDCRNFSSPATVSPACVDGHHYDIWMNNVNIVFRDLSFYSAFDNNICLLDLSGAMDAAVERCFFAAGYPEAVAPQPTGTNGFAVIQSANFTENVNTFDQNVVIGFYNGLGISSSVAGGINWITTCYNAVNAWDGGAIPSAFTALEVYECKNVFLALGCETHYNIGVAVHNNVPGWWEPTIVVNDPGGTLVGRLTVFSNSSVTNGTVVIGGARIEVEDVGQGFGGMASPPTVFRGNYAFQSGANQSLSPYTLALGGTILTKSNTPNTLKYAGFGFTRYQDTNFMACTPFSFEGYSADDTLVNIGSDGGLFSAKGANTIRMFTAPNGISNPVYQMSIDSAGNVIPQNPAGNSLGGPGTVFSSVHGTNVISVGTVYANQIISTNNNGNFFNLIIEKEDNLTDASFIMQTRPLGSAANRWEFRVAPEVADPNGSRFYIKPVGWANYEALVLRTNGMVELRTNVLVAGTLSVGSETPAVGNVHYISGWLRMTNSGGNVNLNLEGKGDHAAYGGLSISTSQFPQATGDNRTELQQLGDSIGGSYAGAFAIAKVNNGGGAPGLQYGAILTTNANWEFNTNMSISGSLRITNSLSTFTNNKSDTVSISVTASVFHWTNNTLGNVFALIDAHSATTASVSINSGTAVYTGLGWWNLPLQRGESFDLTYTGTAPTARWKAW